MLNRLQMALHRTHSAPGRCAAAISHRPSSGCRPGCRSSTQSMTVDHPAAAALGPRRTQPCCERRGGGSPTVGGCRLRLPRRTAGPTLLTPPVWTRVTADPAGRTPAGRELLSAGERANGAEGREGRTMRLEAAADAAPGLFECARDGMPPFPGAAGIAPVEMSRARAMIPCAQRFVGQYTGRRQSNRQQTTSAAAQGVHSCPACRTAGSRRPRARRPCCRRRRRVAAPSRRPCAPRKHGSSPRPPSIGSRGRRRRPAAG